MPARPKRRDPTIAAILKIPKGDVFLLHWVENYALRSRRTDGLIGCVVDCTGTLVQEIIEHIEDHEVGTFRNYSSGHPVNRTIIRLTKHAQAVRLMMAYMGQGERAVAPPRPDEIEEN